MANANAPFGLKPIGENGMPWSGAGRMIYIPSSQGTAIFLGDPLIPLGGSDANGVPAFGLATAAGGAYVAGAFLGNSNGPANSGSTLLQSAPLYHVASVVGYGFITDDPNQLFTIQEDSVGGALAAASAAMENADLIAGVGSTTTGMSGWMLDSSTANTTPTLQLRILELTRGPDNVIGNYARWTVRLNLSSLWHTTGI